LLFPSWESFLLLFLLLQLLLLIFSYAAIDWLAAASVFGA
jgi:hypothetical protein